MPLLSVFRLTAETDTDTELIGLFDHEPTSNDIRDYSEYRGYTLVVHEYEGEVPMDQVLAKTNFTEGDLVEGDVSEEDVMDELTPEDKYDLLENADYSEYVMEQIPKLNEKSDELLSRVQRELAYTLGLNYFAKYQTVWVDNNGNMFGRYDDGRELKHIRIADHTHNPQRGRLDLNIVIAEKDATRGRFHTAINDLVFSDEDEPDDIVKAILSYFK